MNVLKSTSSSYVRNVIENMILTSYSGSVVPCRKQSNDVARQVEIQGKSKFFVARQIFLSRDITITLRQKLHYIITVKHLDSAEDTFSA